MTVHDAFDLGSTFVHLRDGGEAAPVALTPQFWSESTTGAAAFDRVVGCFEFRSSDDLHSSMQEMHPEADELLFVVSGAIEVGLEEPSGERMVRVEAGHATIVPRGVWHRLLVRAPGRLLFVNSRKGMLTRSWGAR